MKKTAANTRTTEDRLVAARDPLKCDSYVLDEFIALNKRADLDKLSRRSEQFANAIKRIPRISRLDSLAALRDLGLMAASLRRHGGGLALAPVLENALYLLSIKTQEIPRDTIYSYGPRNPEGLRQRTFTGTKQEKEFVNSFSVGLASLEQSLAKLLIVSKKHLHDSTLPEMEGAVFDLSHLVDAIANVRRTITPEFFTSVLRPYFEPIEIRGKVYYAPGGAQMPLLIIDRIIWGSFSDPIFREYWHSNMPYLPKRLRRAASLPKHSILEVMSDNKFSSPNRKQWLKFAVALVNVIHSFRYPHLAIARENFLLRPEKSLGSGGYDISTLEYLIKSLHQAKDRFLDLSKRMEG